MTSRSWVAVAAAIVASAVGATPVGPPLSRAAVPSVAPAKGWMLGAARAGQRLVAVGERGLVVVSDDGGRQWRQVPVPVSVTLTAIRFVDERHGYAIGHGGVVLATVDAGEHWLVRLEGHQAARLMVEEARTSGDAAALAAAQRLVSDGADKPLLDLHFFDARHGLVVGAYNLALETRDGGLTWRSWSARLPNPRGLHLYSIRVNEQQILIAGEQGLVVRSRDGGDRFETVQTPYRGSFFTAELLGEQRLLLAGLRGNAWLSEDGGATWQQQQLKGASTVLASVGLDRGRVLLADQTGQVFVRDPATGEWQRPIRTPFPLLNGISSIGDDRFLLATPMGVMPWALPAASAN